MTSPGPAFHRAIESSARGGRSGCTSCARCKAGSHYPWPGGDGCGRPSCDIPWTDTPSDRSWMKRTAVECRKGGHAARWATSKILAMWTWGSLHRRGVRDDARITGPTALAYRNEEATLASDQGSCERSRRGLATDDDLERAYRVCPAGEVRDGRRILADRSTRGDLAILGRTIGQVLRTYHTPLDSAGMLGLPAFAADTCSCSTSSSSRCPSSARCSCGSTRSDSANRRSSTSRRRCSRSSSDRRSTSWAGSTRAPGRTRASVSWRGSSWSWSSARPSGSWSSTRSWS